MTKGKPDPARMAKVKADAAAAAAKRERELVEYREDPATIARMAGNHQPDYREPEATCPHCLLKVSCPQCLHNGYCEVCMSWSLGTPTSSFPGLGGAGGMSFSTDAHGNVGQLVWA